MAYDENFLRRTYGAGRSDAQAEQINSLRMNALRTDARRMQEQYSEAQLRANTEFLANGSAYVMQHPEALPGFIEEGVRRKVFNPGFDQGKTPEELLSTLPDLHHEAMAALAPGPKDPGPLVQTVGPDGKPIYTPRSGASGMEAYVGQGGVPSQLQTFNTMTEGLTDEEKERARRIELGLDPRAVGSAAITISNQDLTDDVADSEATIAGRKKFSELSAASRAKAIDSGFESIQAIDDNVRNLERAVVELDNGAATGAIVTRYTPTVRAATVALEQIQGDLGLDVVQATTFGALSKGELDLAKAVALPTGLQPPELRQWIQDKIAAQTKLRAYFQEQIDFLDKGGTIAGFLRSKEREVNSNDVEHELSLAREALQKGKSRAAIEQALQSKGIDPGLL